MDAAKRERADERKIGIPLCMAFSFCGGLHWRGRNAHARVASSRPAQLPVASPVLYPWMRVHVVAAVLDALIKAAIRGVPGVTPKRPCRRKRDRPPRFRFPLACHDNAVAFSPHQSTSRARGVSGGSCSHHLGA